MAKPHRPDGKKQRAASPEALDFAASLGVAPPPPKRRPWLLLAAAVAMALWLLFLLWMAVDTAE